MTLQDKVSRIVGKSSIHGIFAIIATILWDMSAHVEKMSEQMGNTSKELAVITRVVTSLEDELEYRRKIEAQQQNALSDHESRLRVIESYRNRK